jgi:multicomponent Na+:H+ antiporter subunit D
MIKAGLLGWLRFLPLGEAALPAVGGLLTVLGLIGAFYAALVGFTQREAKTVLAYSSVSQMGLVTLAVGLALVSPPLWPAASIVTLAFAMHHGLVKGALFLGIGVGSPSVVLVGLSLAALAMIGLPLTGGALVKSLLKEVVGGGWLELLVSLSATGTTLLMLRVLVLVGRRPTAATAHLLPFWLASLVAALIALPLWAYAAGWPLTEHLGLSLDKAWVQVWPGLLGLSLFTALGGFGRLRFWLPPGDLLVGLELLWHRFRPEVRPASVTKPSHPKPVPSLTWLDRFEVRQRRWDNIGLLWLSLGALLILIMLGGNGG